MSSTALKILALVALALAIGLGLVAYRMSQNIAAPPATAPTDAAGPAAAQTMAVVALKPLAAYAAVPADAVALVPVAVLPDQYFTRTEDVVGKAPLTDVPTGTTLGPRFFREANTLVRSIPPGFQAMSLEINDVIAVGGFVRPGDLVDVLLYIRSTGREVEDSQARILLREARVLAYEDRILNEAEYSDGLPDASGRAGLPAPADSSARTAQQQRTRRIRTAVLAVPEADTTRVMLGASLGELRLSLRGAAPAPGAETPAEGTATPVAATAPVDPAQQDKVVTLRELSAIRKRQQASGAPAPKAPPMIIYRGNEVQRVSR
jgi:pilus assembly protein CpaB